MRDKADVVIIGAGISGCAAAQELQSRGVDYLLLERNPEPGGLTRSFSVGEGHFDYTGHFLHLSRCASPAELPYARQNNADWQLIEKRAVVHIKGHAVPAPLQYHLHALPEPWRRRCLEDYRSRLPNQNPANFREYLLAGFGSQFCEIFFFPYNEKTMATHLEGISKDTANRFFPNPDEKKIEAGSRERRGPVSPDYNSYFWYPKHRGIGLLSERLADGLDRLRTCCRVEKVDLVNKKLMTSQGPIGYDRLLTSEPLKTFCGRTNNRILRTLARRLSHNKVLCFNLLLKEKVARTFRGCHWIYVPDRDIPFYRWGVYSHLPVDTEPPDASAIYVEVAFSHEEQPVISKVLDQVLAAFERKKWFQRKDCVVIAANWIDCAYVHFRPDRDAVVGRMMALLQARGVYPIGRYGLWDYSSMEDSIYSGIETARRVMA
jgi:protoporphyrinogen oxidase